MKQTLAITLASAYKGETLVRKAAACADIALHELQDLDEDFQWYFSDSSSLHIWTHPVTCERITTVLGSNPSAHNSARML